MNKQYPIKLARVCALCVVLAGLLTAGIYYYISLGGSAEDLPKDGIIVASIGLLIALTGVLLIFVLPRGHKVLVAVMLALVVASLYPLSIYVLLLRMALTAGPVGGQWFIPILLPVVYVVLPVWLLIASRPYFNSRKQIVKSGSRPR